MTVEFPIGGGGSGGWYQQNPYYINTDPQYYSGGNGTIHTVPGYVTGTGINITTTGGSITIGGDSLLGVETRTGNNRLSAEQLAFLLAEHRFMDMNNGEYCLFCFALDIYRTKLEHIFVIHEE